MCFKEQKQKLATVTCSPGMLRVIQMTNQMLKEHSFRCQTHNAFRQNFLANLELTYLKGLAFPSCQLHQTVNSFEVSLEEADF